MAYFRRPGKPPHGPAGAILRASLPFAINRAYVSQRPGKTHTLVSPAQVPGSRDTPGVGLAGCQDLSIVSADLERARMLRIFSALRYRACSSSRLGGSSGSSST